MRALILSDIHSNLAALNAVFKHAKDYDQVWCLGDVVGYGPQPNECIARLLEAPPLTCILGNHDAAAIDLLDISSFNHDARLSVEWMQSVLRPESIEFLENLPKRIEKENATLVHGSPRSPVFEYLLDTVSAAENFNYFDSDYCFIGHSHLPSIFKLEPDDPNVQLDVPRPNNKIKLNGRAIINPGSVGQPRDRIPLAAYAIYDSDENTWEFFRTAYDITATQAAMEELGLPERHIIRLDEGW